jgi:hypothetical protein
MRKVWWLTAVVSRMNRASNSARRPASSLPMNSGARPTASAALEAPQRPVVGRRRDLGRIDQDRDVEARRGAATAVEAPAREMPGRGLRDEAVVRIRDVVRPDEGDRAQFPALAAALEMRAQQRRREQVEQGLGQRIVALGGVAPEVDAELEGFRAQ